MEELPHGGGQDVARLYSGCCGQAHHRDKDEDDDFVEGQETTDLSAGKINEGLATLSASLQQMKEQADAIVVEENAAKRQRTAHSLQGDQAVEVGDSADSKASSKPPFASPGCP